MFTTIKTAPTSEPLSLEEVRDHLLLEDTRHDSTLNGYLQAAREFVEDHCGRALMEQIITLYLDKFPGGYGFDLAINLPRPPLKSVTSVKYVDTAGNQQTLTVTDDYLAEAARLGSWDNALPRVTLAWNKSWPATRVVINAVEVEYKVGVTDKADVPKGIKQALRLMVGHFFNNREHSIEANLQTIPLGVFDLLRNYRVEK